MHLSLKQQGALLCTLLILSSALCAALIASVPESAHAQANAQAGATTGNLPAQSQDSNCSIISPSNWFEACVWIPLMSWLGSWFLTIGGGLLRLAGTLFDVLVYKVIINFKGTLDFLHITDAVNSGWTVFRDFSNILIIGIFVFIAISIILGLKEFGQKKLIANVLIVAVLINFSLLFTKIIIDASNFTALQIYNQMVGASGAADGIGGTPDLSGSFLRPMGITSVWNDTNLVTKQIGQQNQSGLLAFLYGFVGGLLLAAAAGVLFYGCFLIAARAILFIFLMLTAALAFATYLVPTLAHGEYGWSAWWKALINNAIFAPLLMLFLAVSLGIVNQAGAQKIAGTTLGSIIINPSTQLSSNGWTAILIYVIGIGLLFVSFRMAGKFAGTISGFQIGGALAGIPLAATFRTAAPILRNTLGRSAARKSLALDEEIDKQKVRASLAPHGAQREAEQSRLAHLLHDKGQLDTRAKRTFDFMNTSAGQAFGKIANLPGVLTEKTKANYAETAKAVAEHAAKEAAAAAVPQGDAEKYAKEQLGSERNFQKQSLKDAHDTNTQLVNAANKLAEAASKKENLTQQKSELATVERDAKQRKLEIHKEYEEARGKIPAAQRQEQLDEQDARIRQAREASERITARESQIANETGLTSAKQEHAKSAQALAEFESTLTADATERARTIVNQSRENAKEIAATLAKHESGIWRKITGDDEIFAEQARRKVGDKIKSKRVKDQITALRELDKEDRGGEAAKEGEQH